MQIIHNMGTIQRQTATLNNVCISLSLQDQQDAINFTRYTLHHLLTKKGKVVNLI